LWGGAGGKGKKGMDRVCEKASRYAKVGGKGEVVRSESEAKQKKKMIGNPSSREAHVKTKVQQTIKISEGPRKGGGLTEDGKKSPIEIVGSSNVKLGGKVGQEHTQGP